MPEYICESCQKHISESEPHHKYEDVVECEECHNYTRYEIGRTG